MFLNPCPGRVFQQPANGSVPAFSAGIFTYRLGLGRRVNDTWSGAVMLGPEPHQDNEVGNLEGTDGYISDTLALTHETESWDVNGAISYIDLGNAVSNAKSFSGNDAVAFGLKVGLRFLPEDQRTAPAPSRVSHRRCARMCGTPLA